MKIGRMKMLEGSRTRGGASPSLRRLRARVGTAAEQQSVTLVWWHNVTQGPA